MSLRTLLFVAFACLIYNNEASDILKSLPQAQVVLQKFLDLVEANQLNISIVTSRAQYWSNGQLQDLKDNALLLPPNDVILTQTQLSQKIGKQWLSDLQPWTSQGGIATYRVISIQNGDISEQLVESSKLEAIPMTPSYESILTPEEIGSEGLVSELGDYEIMYNYLIPGSKGQNESVSVFAVNLNITILGNSENMPLTEINKIKQILSKIWMTFNDYDLIAQYLVETLNAQMPLSQATWQVLIGPELFSIPSGKWVGLSIADVNVIVLALPL